MHIIKIELTQPIRAIAAYDAKTGTRYTHAWVTVTFHAQPLGMITVELPEQGVSAEELSEQIWSNLNSEIAHHLRSNILAQSLKLVRRRVATTRHLKEWRLGE